MLPSPNSAFSTFSPSIAVTSFLKFLLWPGELDGVELCGGLGSTATEFELHHLHVLLLDHGGQVLGEKVGAVLRAWHLHQRNDLLGDLLLQPQDIHVYMSDFRNPLSLQDALRSRRVEVKSNRNLETHILTKGG